MRGICAPASAGAGRARARIAIALAATSAAVALAQKTPAAATAPWNAPANGSATLPAMARPQSSPLFAIRGFKVTGDNPLGDGETSRVLAPFLRADATIDTLQAATAALETALRQRGYGLHRVALPPQEVGGEVVTFNVVKFTVNAVRVDGNSIYDAQNVRQALPELREGATPNFKTLAIQTAIANENPNKQVQVGLRESDKPDQIDADVKVTERRPWSFAAGISNYGASAESGRDRFTVTAGHTNLFNLDHQFFAAYTTSIEEPGDVRQFGLSYRIPFYALGGVLGATYTKSDVVGNFGTFTSTGAGHTEAISFTKYLEPMGGRRSYVVLSLDDRFYRAADISGVVAGLDRRSVPVTLTYLARVESDRAVWGYNVDLAANTGWGSNNDLTSYRSENPRIDTKMWTAVRGGFTYVAPLQSWQWLTRIQYQWSPDVLISGEQFGLGGFASVRGTGIDRAITGDMGVAATLETATPELSPGLRLIGFADAGWLGNNKPNDADKPSSDRIASIGMGLRYARDPWAISLDYGRLVAGSRVPLTLNSASPQKGDDRLYFNVAVHF